MSTAQNRVDDLKRTIKRINDRIDNPEIGIGTLATIKNFEREIQRSLDRGDETLARSQTTTLERIRAELAQQISFRTQIEAELVEAETALVAEKKAKAEADAAKAAAEAEAKRKATEEEKKRVEDSKSGATAAAVNQSQSSGGGTAPKSEANFSGDQPATNSSGSVKGSGVSGNTSDFQSQPTEKPPYNKLHDYTSYTYRITLFFLTVKDFNNLTANPSGFNPRYALISSAGGYAKASSNTDQDTIRHRDFRTDFFIDGLSIETVVGLNAKNKSSNAIDIKFTITEPYGLSLLDRLLSACEMSEDRNPNYATQPYLLQIDLLASPTDEMLIKNKQTDNLIDRKRIAIKITEMKIKPSATGSTYSISCIPYNHSAFDQTVAPVPVPLKVEAKTVGEFFSNTDDQALLFAGELNANEERLEAELDKWIKSNPIVFNQIGRAPNAAEIEQKKKALRDAIVYNSGSYTAAYNSYMRDVASKAKVTKLPPTQISFTMPKEIADSSIVDELAQSSDGVFSNPSSGIDKTFDANLKKKLVFPINAGTNIIDVIDQVLGKSDYIKNQINTKNKLENDAEAKDEYSSDEERVEDKPAAKNLKWYKIIPTVELRDYDRLRNNYSKAVNYTIVPYTAANAYHPNFPKTKGTDVSKEVVREYNYAYTGKNQDVLRVDIDFDTAFYTQISPFKNQVARGGTNRFSDPNNISDNYSQPEDKSTATIIPRPPK